MRGLFDIIASLMLVIALMTGTAAHAVEIRGHVAVEAADDCSQASDREKEAPADSGKALMHHHGCHGHHVGVAIDPAAVVTSIIGAPTLPLPLAQGVASLAPKSMFRPPIA